MRVRAERGPALYPRDARSGPNRYPAALPRFAARSCAWSVSAERGELVRRGASSEAEKHPTYAIGVDLGQANDYTAVCVMERFTAASLDAAENGEPKPKGIPPHGVKAAKEM